MIEAKLRKRKDILISSGKAVILFGIWSIVRIILAELFDPEELKELIGNVSGTPDEVYLVLSFVMIIALMSIDLLIRYYVGKSAISEGNGQKRNVAYIILAGIYVAVTIAFDCYGITALKDGVTIMVISTFLIDISSSFAFAEIMFSALMVRYYEKRLTEKETHAA